MTCSRIRLDRRATVADLVLELRKIVNVRAWGWHVTTLGYGDAQGLGRATQLRVVRPLLYVYMDLRAFRANQPRPTR